MLQNRKESLIAILGILFVGSLSMAGILDRVIGIVLALLIFAISECFTCYRMKQNKENWKKEALLGTVMILILLYLLFFKS